MELSVEWWDDLRAHFYYEIAQRLLLAGQNEAVSMVLDWAEREARKE